ncbi:hypothetical protein ZWY2020_024147 [Hordeum vulgare]|nr:hypothetical protein ZWY2020_024147 [Hordeum vulgare]
MVRRCSWATAHRRHHPRAVLPPIVTRQRICPSKPDAFPRRPLRPTPSLSAKDPQFLYASVESNLRPAVVELTGLGLSRSAPRLHLPCRTEASCGRSRWQRRRCSSSAARQFLLVLLVMDPWHSVFSCSVAMYLPGVVPPACSGLAVVPVLMFPDGEDYVPSMRQGFLLEWTVSSDDCPKCEASGGQCRYANDGTGFSAQLFGVYPDKCGELRKINRRCQP